MLKILQHLIQQQELVHIYLILSILLKPSHNTKLKPTRKYYKYKTFMKNDATDADDNLDKNYV